MVVSEIKIIIRALDYCNLSCDYCYLDKKNTYKLNIDDALKLVESLFKVLSQSAIVRTTLVWHGGEPLLLGEDFFNQVFYHTLILGQKYNIEVKHSIQTNLTIPLTTQFLNILRYYYVPIGTSIDLPTSYENDYRFKSHSHIREIWLSNMAKLKRFHIGRSINCVITDQNYLHMKEFYSFCKRLNTSFTIAPLISNFEHDERGHLFYSEQYVTAFKHLYDAFTSDNDPVLAQTIVEMVSNVIVRKPRLCVFQSNCNKNFLGLDANGDLYQCARYIGIESFRLSNLLEADSFQLIEALSQLKPSPIPNKCIACRHFDICNGGCPYMRAINHGEDIHCQAYKEIYEFIEKQGLSMDISLNTKSPTTYTRLSRKHDDVVIVAPGASTDEVLSNNTELHDIDVISVNSLFKSKNLKVDYCFVIDKRVVNALAEDIMNTPNTTFITCDKNYDDKVINMYPISAKRGIGFSNDYQNGVYLCGSSSYAAIQFAYSMGYRSIYIVGFDLGMYKNRLYSTDYYIENPDKNRISDRLNKFEHESYAYKFLSNTNHDVLKRVKVINLSDNELLNYFSQIPGLPKEYVKTGLQVSGE